MESAPIRGRPLKFRQGELRPGSQFFFASGLVGFPFVELSGRVHQALLGFQLGFCDVITVFIGQFSLCPPEVVEGFLDLRQ